MLLSGAYSFIPIFKFWIKKNKDSNVKNYLIMKKLIKTELAKKCKSIKIVLTDVDGVLTDGGMYYSKNGEVMKKFNTRDGMGVELLSKNHIGTIIITKEKSEIVKQRGKKKSLKRQNLQGKKN